MNGGSESRELRSARVLVVDDEPGMRMTTAANLELEGFVVCEAASAEEALRILETESYDVVFTDIRMPGMTGIELFRALRSSGNRTPVVLMTAFHDELPTRRALEDGVFTLLVKPFDMSNAIRVVSNAARGPVALVVAPGAAEIATHLEARGHLAARAETFESAEAMLASANVDVCVLDLDQSAVDTGAIATLASVTRPDLALVGVGESEIVAEEVPVKFDTVVDTAKRQPDLKDIVLAIAKVRGAPRVA